MVHRPVVTGCYHSNYEKPLYNETTWKFLRRSYRDAVGKRKSTIYNSEDSDDNDDSDSGPTGFQVPYEVKYSPIRGRSIYATAPIKRGTLIWSADYDASFRTEKSLRKFLDLLPFELQCEILLWAYPVDSGSAHCALDDASFVNHGDTADIINYGDDDRATRNIDAGEEILMNYTEFIAYDEVDWFDDIRAAAWDENYNKNKNNNNKDIMDNLNHYHSTKDYNRIGAPPITQNNIKKMKKTRIVKNVESISHYHHHNFERDRNIKPLHRENSLRGDVDNDYNNLIPTSHLAIVSFGASIFLFYFRRRQKKSKYTL